MKIFMAELMSFFNVNQLLDSPIISLLSSNHTMLSFYFLMAGSWLKDTCKAIWVQNPCRPLQFNRSRWTMCVILNFLVATFEKNVLKPWTSQNSGKLAWCMVGKIPWRRKWQPTPIFLPEKSHGQRCLVGYSP